MNDMVQERPRRPSQQPLDARQIEQTVGAFVAERAVPKRGVRDLAPGYAGDGFVGPGVPLDGAAYFAGHDPERGVELWKTDGTASGTQRLGDRIEDATSRRSSAAPTGSTD